MLSNRTFLPTKSLFVAAGIAACGLAVAQQSANALSVNFAGQTGTSYDYTLTIQDGETLSPGDTVAFNGLTEVTGGSVAPTLSFFFDPPSTTSSSALFTATGTSGGLSGTIGTFTIESTALPDFVDASINGGVPAPVLGPAVASPTSSVPFEFSPGLGLFLSGTIFGALKLRSKFGKKEEINF